MLREKKPKWHTFLGLGPTSFSYNAKAASYPLKLGSRPYNNIFRNTNAIGEITL